MGRTLRYPDRTIARFSPGTLGRLSGAAARSAQCLADIIRAAVASELDRREAPAGSPPTLEALQHELRTLREVLTAARCIRHWHDTLPNAETGECEGMVVSAEHVRAMWSRIGEHDAAMGT